MRIYVHRVICVTLTCAIAGCASNAQRSGLAPTTQYVATTQISDPKALLTLNDIQPAVSMPAAPATQVGRIAPLEALQLFARARAAVLENKRFTAIGLLERAVAIDPGSFELFYELGRANLGNSADNAQAIKAFEK